MKHGADIDVVCGHLDQWDEKVDSSRGNTISQMNSV